MKSLVVTTLVLISGASSANAKSLITPGREQADDLLCATWFGKFDDASADIHVGNTTQKTRFRLCRRGLTRSQITVEGRDSEGETVLSKADIFTNGCVDVWWSSFYLTKVPLNEEIGLNAAEAKCFQSAKGGWQSGGYATDLNGPARQTIVDLEASTQTKVCLNGTHAIELNVKKSPADPGTVKTFKLRGHGFVCEMLEAQRLELLDLNSSLPGENYYIWYGDCLLENLYCVK